MIDQPCSPPLCRSQLARLQPGFAEFTEAERALPPIPLHLLETHEFYQLVSQSPETLPSLRGERLQESKSRTAFFCDAEEWNSDHLLALRIIPIVDLPLHMLFPAACHRYFKEAEQDPLFQTLKEQIMTPPKVLRDIYGQHLRHPFFSELDDLWDPQFANFQLSIIRWFVSSIEEPFRKDEISRGIETAQGMAAGGGMDECNWYMGRFKKHQWKVEYRAYIHPLAYPPPASLRSLPVCFQADKPPTDGATAGVMIGFLAKQFLKKRGLPRSGPQSFLFGIYRCKAYVASAQWPPEYLHNAKHRSEIPAGMYAVTRRSVMFDLRKPEDRAEFIKVYYVLRIAFQKGLVV
ncbi:hypothetical protein C8J56DRAFT_1043145 [Mycena floridula]|nr:hypothetical protein C8J56DRAFT_1043145 [Mycena floridula]